MRVYEYERYSYENLICIYVIFEANGVCTCEVSRASAGKAVGFLM